MITSATGHWRNDGFGTHMVFPAVLKQEIWHRNLHPSRNGLLAFIQRLEGFRLEKGGGGQWSVMNWWLLFWGVFFKCWQHIGGCQSSGKLSGEIIYLENKLLLIPINLKPQCKNSYNLPFP